MDGINKHTIGEKLVKQLDELAEKNETAAGLEALTAAALNLVKAGIL